MGSLSLNGNILLGAQGACEGGGAQGVVNLPFSIGACGGCSGISAAASTYGTKSVSSLSAYVVIPGVGANDAVTKALFLFVKSTTPVTLRLTQDTVVTPQTLDVNGLVVLQFPTDKPLTLVEVKGVATLEYVATGNL